MTKTASKAGTAAPTSFRDIMATPTDKFSRPPALPEGHYAATITNYEIGKSSQKGTPFVEVVFKVTGTAEVEGETDVDQDTLDELGIDLGSNPKEQRKKYYITPAAAWRYRDFLDAVLGEEEGRTFDERSAEIKGVDCVLHITTRESDNEEGVFFNDIRAVLKAA